MYLCDFVKHYHSLCYPTFKCIYPSIEHLVPEPTVELLRVGFWKQKQSSFEMKLYSVTRQLSAAKSAKATHLCNFVTQLRDSQECPTRVLSELTKFSLVTIHPAVLLKFVIQLITERYTYNCTENVNTYSKFVYLHYLPLGRGFKASCPRMLKAHPKMRCLIFFFFFFFSIPLLLIHND